MLALFDLFQSGSVLYAPHQVCALSSGQQFSLESEGELRSCTQKRRYVIRIQVSSAFRFQLGVGREFERSEFEKRV